MGQVLSSKIFVANRGAIYQVVSENLPVADRLLTVGQVAENWQVSERTVRRMIGDGRLPVVHLGRAVRISVKVVAR